MKRTINKMVLIATTILVTIGMAAAVPEVSNVAMAQREGSRIVEITYDLSEAAAIVTLGIETNGVAIPDSAVTRLTGDVSTVIQPGTGKTIVWNAGLDWPENLTEVAKAKVTAWSTSAPPQVMVIDLSKGSAASEADPYVVYYYNSLDALPGGGLSNDVYKTTMLVMNKIPSGVYDMGDESVEGASVRVTLTKDFYASVYQVTQKQWYKVMGTTPSVFTNPVNPAVHVSYELIRGSVDGAAWPANNFVDASSFIGKIRDKTGLLTFDLPTDAQWEYACRATTITYFNDGIEGSSTNQLNELGWWQGNNEGGTHPVGLKMPNLWGLYDMHGNVYELCLDWLGDSLQGGVDPVGAQTGTKRVQRGGSYVRTKVHCRSSFRASSLPSYHDVDIGFRLVRTLP